MYLIKNARHTEKSLKLNELRQYTFLVAPKANKVEIKKQVDELYNVVVTRVNTARYAGKKISRYTRKGTIEGQRSLYKKAVVTLREGDIIDIHKDSL